MGFSFLEPHGLSRPDQHRCTVDQHSTGWDGRLEVYPGRCTRVGVYQAVYSPGYTRVGIARVSPYQRCIAGYLPTNGV